MFGFLGDVASVVMTPLHYVVTAALLAWREIWALVLPADSGWTWALAIVGLAVTIRVLLMPFYLLQHRARRDMQQLLPKIRALQEAYAHDRERLSEEQMKLFKKSGASPYIFWLPLILLGIVLLALFQVIDASAKYAPSDGSFRRGFVTGTEAQSLSQAKLFGARIADTVFTSSNAGSAIVIAALIAAIAATHLIAHGQERAARPDVGLGDVFAKQERFLLVASLAVCVACGLVLSLGALIFWATSYVWTVAQQQVLRDDPGPDPGPQPST